MFSLPLRVISFIFHFEPSITFAVKYHNNFFNHGHLVCSVIIVLTIRAMYQHSFSCLESAFAKITLVFIFYLHLLDLLFCYFYSIRLSTCCVNVFTIPNRIFISVSSLDVSPIAFRHTVIYPTTSSAGATSSAYPNVLMSRILPHFTPLLSPSVFCIIWSSARINITGGIISSCITPHLTSNFSEKIVLPSVPLTLAMPEAVLKNFDRFHHFIEN